MPSEYAHAMGNSTGNFVGQWDAIYRYPNLQGRIPLGLGGPGPAGARRPGTPFLGLRRDFGGEYTPSDGNFCCNGLVLPDRTPHPALAEVKYVQQDFGFEPEGAGRVRITNRFYFTPSEKYRFICRLVRDGKTVREKELDVRLAPQESAVFTTFGPEEMRGEGEYFADFSVITRKASEAVPAGYEIAAGQIPLGGTPEEGRRAAERPRTRSGRRRGADRRLVAARALRIRPPEWFGDVLCRERRRVLRRRIRSEAQLLARPDGQRLRKRHARAAAGVEDVEPRVRRRGGRGRENRRRRTHRGRLPARRGKPLHHALYGSSVGCRRNPHDLHVHRRGSRGHGGSPKPPGPRRSPRAARRPAARRRSSTCRASESASGCP